MSEGTASDTSRSRSALRVRSSQSSHPKRRRRRDTSPRPSSSANSSVCLSRRRTSTCRSRPKHELVANLRVQLEALNGVTFSDAEWASFFAEKIAGANEGIVEKTVRIQEDHVQVLRRDDGSTKNVTLIDKTQHPQQPAAGHQPVRGRSGRGWSHALKPLRRDGPRQRAAAGAHRAQAPRRRHPRGVQPDRPLPARQLLVWALACSSTCSCS